MSETETFATRLKRAIEEKGVSQTDLATKIGLDRSELNRLVNGKRAPRPREAAALIEALGVDPDRFLKGLDLADDPTFADEVESYGKLIRRVLDAERERDDAQASRNALDASLHAEEIEWRQERDRLLAALSDARRDCAARLKQRDDELARREQELLGELAGVRDQSALLQRQLRAANELASERLRQVAELQGALERERGRVLATGVFSGIVGAVLGGGVGAVVARNSDDDKDED